MNRTEYLAEAMNEMVASRRFILFTETRDGKFSVKSDSQSPALCGYCHHKMVELGDRTFCDIAKQTGVLDG